MNIQRILCPVDFSEASRLAIQEATAIAGCYNARITALHVYEPIFMPVSAVPATADRVPSVDTQYLHDQTVACFHETVAAGIGVDVAVDIGVTESLYVEILHLADEARADLIVLGVHGRNAVDLLMFGSTTNQVVRRATCPVLTWRQ